MGAFKPAKPVNISSQKGYSFRDTDDRINRLKSQPTESLSAYQGIAASSNGKVGKREGSFLVCVFWLS